MSAGSSVPRFLGFSVALLAGACCSTLPHLASKRVPFPAPRERFESVIETTGHFFDDKRDGRDVPIRTYSPAGTLSVERGRRDRNRR